MNKNITVLEAEILLCHILQVDRSFLKTHPDTKLSSEQRSKFFELIYRRKKHEPIAYLLGKKDFWDLDLLVNKDVLIPRSETEMLVEKALEILPKYSSARILELGTGSGAISLSIAKHRKNVSIVATDISLVSLKVAKMNAKILNIKNIKFLCCDWFKAISCQLSKKFDLIISNPPYIGINEMILCDQEIFYEPKVALFSEEEGFSSLKTIISSSTKYLNTPGYLLLEHGFNQKNKLMNLFQSIRCFDIQTFKDLSGLDRIIVASKHSIK
jgi:release factor glutamine methyltransferase